MLAAKEKEKKKKIDRREEDEEYYGGAVSEKLEVSEYFVVLRTAIRRVNRFRIVSALLSTTYSTMHFNVPPP